jgi:hypothetical protein
MMTTPAQILESRGRRAPDRETVTPPPSLLFQVLEHIGANLRWIAWMFGAPIIPWWRAADDRHIRRPHSPWRAR